MLDERDRRGVAGQFRVDEKGPSRATSYCRPCCASTPPPRTRVGKSITGAPDSSVAPTTVIGAATISPAGLR
jgi:hypothetical protein